MIASLMLYSLLLGALLCAGATLLDWAARRAAVPRRWGWLGALALLVALTAVAPFRVATTVGTSALPELAGATVVADAAPAVASMGLLERTSAGLASLLSLPVKPMLSNVAERVPASVDAAIGWGWGIAALTCLFLTGWALNRLDRQRRNWPRATVRGLPVRVAANHGPAVYGVFEPDIVLPSALLSRSDDEQQLVLTHEDEHRRAYDPALLALSAIGVSLMPWNPFAWWCASRLRLAVELDCDARVLARGATPRRYGELLLTLSSAMSHRRGLVPALSLLDSRHHLERRIIAMTARPRRRTPLHMAAVLALGTVVAAAACSTDLPTAAEIEAADVAMVTEQLVTPGSQSIAYFVDGKQVSAREAKELTGDAISSIEVVKEQGATPGTGEVHIITKGEFSRLEPARKFTVKGDGETVIVEGSEKGSFMWKQKDGGSNAVATIDVKGKEGGSTVRLRGDSLHVSGTSASGAEPLLVVDGVLVAGGKAALGKAGLTPDKIASIEVIKGEAATALYGSRAAGGLIKITTKEHR